MALPSPLHQMPDAHARPPGDVLRALHTSETGLAGTEAARRLRVHGDNALAPPARVSAWRILVDQFTNVVTALLASAAVVALAMGDVPESLAIVSVLVVNATIGFTTEFRAKREMDALRRLTLQRAHVLRDGLLADVDARELVPGDVILVEAGETVPADARIVTADDARADEAALTGESMPASKTADPAPADAVVADQESMLFRGTTLVAGAARAVVTTTGRRTELGRIADLISAVEDEETPIELRLAKLGRRLVVVTLVIAAAVIALGAARGIDTWYMLETGLALAVAAVPEALPAVVTICLAVGMRRMARRRALVRRLPAVETLGQVTVVCTDKTGTLTAGEMTVTRLAVAGRTVDVSGAGYLPVGDLSVRGARVVPADVPGLHDALTTGAATCRATRSEADGRIVIRGDPTEAALVVAAEKAGIRGDDLDAETAALPFASSRMLAASFRRGINGVRLHVTGAPERVLQLAARWIAPTGEEPLDDAARNGIRAANEHFAAHGLRVVALATRPLSGDDPHDEDAVRDLTFLALAGILDPPAAGVRAAIATLAHAGVRTVMITGDQRATALAVARELGLPAGPDRCVSGRELDALDEPALAEKVLHASTFSRIGPEGKQRIVAALRAGGEVVAMLGDGVNDAPALKGADIGVAMGRRGTDVAKETADIVLLDDRFETVCAAAAEGRTIFDNLRRFVFYLFSCNAAEVLVVGAAMTGGADVPLSPLQLLWLNLVTDVFPALALAVEPPEPDVMRRPPLDPQETVLSRRFVGWIAVHAVLIGGVTLGAFAWALGPGGLDDAAARTIAFLTLSGAQILHVLNARSDRPVLLGRQLFGNPWAWGAIALTLALQAAVVTVAPLAAVVGVAPLPASAWIVVALGSVVPLFVGQALRLVLPPRRDVA